MTFVTQRLSFFLFENSSQCLHTCLLSILDDHLGLMKKDGRAECITAHVPTLDCWVRNAMGLYYEPYNQALYSWINETKPLADPNEPPFWPTFDNYQSLACVNDSRLDFDKVLYVDSMKRPAKVGC